MISKEALGIATNIVDMSSNKSDFTISPADAIQITEQVEAFLLKEPNMNSILVKFDSTLTIVGDLHGKPYKILTYSNSG
jgi:hypothetical protein